VLGTLAPDLRGALKVGGNWIHVQSVTRDCGNSVQRLWLQCAQRVALVEFACFAQIAQTFECC
jgi:hypothetical protein